METPRPAPLAHPCADCGVTVTDACVRCEPCLARISSEIDACFRRSFKRQLAEAIPGTYAHAHARLGLLVLEERHAAEQALAVATAPASAAVAS